MLSNLTEKPVPFVLAAADDFSVGYISAGSTPLVGLHAPRTSVIQAIAQLPAETTRTVPLQLDAQMEVPTRSGGTKPVFMQPGVLPKGKLNVPTWSISPPPAQETGFQAPGVLQSPPTGISLWRLPCNPPATDVNDK